MLQLVLLLPPVTPSSLKKIGESRDHMAAIVTVDVAALAVAMATAMEAVDRLTEELIVADLVRWRP
jgi:hypothetical protein